MVKKTKDNESAVETLEKLKRIAPLINRVIDTTSFERQVAVYSEKAANGSEVHQIMERLQRFLDILMSMIDQKKHEILVKYASIPALSEEIREDVENANDDLLTNVAYKAAIDTKKAYIMELDNLIAEKENENSYDDSLNKLSGIANIARQFSPMEPI